MTTIQISFALMLLMSSQDTHDPLSINTDTSIHAIFVGTTPCGPGIRPFHQVAEQAACAEVAWKLTLYHHPNTHQPTTFTLSSVNRYSLPVTNMSSQPGIKNELEGKWKIVKDDKTMNGNKVYQLDLQKPNLSIRLIQLDDNLLHVLNEDGSLMVGNPFFNYTLSRSWPTAVHTKTTAASIPEAKAVVPSTTSKAISVLFADFEGRTPCKEIAADLGIRATAACEKRKLRLILYKDSISHAPTIYELKGMGEKSGKGNWQIVKGMRGNAEAVVYQLELGDKNLYLLKGDENVLFFLDKDKNLLPGNSKYSYTINRIRNKNSWSQWQELANKGLSF